MLSCYVIDARDESRELCADNPRLLHCHYVQYYHWHADND